MLSCFCKTAENWWDLDFVDEYSCCDFVRSGHSLSTKEQIVTSVVEQ